MTTADLFYVIAAVLFGVTAALSFLGRSFIPALTALGLACLAIAALVL